MQPVQRKALSALALVLIYAAVVVLLPRPETIKPESWRLLGIFAATIAGPDSAAHARGRAGADGRHAGLDLRRPHHRRRRWRGYGDPTVWLVMAAFFISDALIKTGLARRIALLFVRAVGRSSLGVCYALSTYRHGAGEHHPFECGALGRRGAAHRAVHRRTLRLAARRHGRPAGRVPDDGGLPEHLRHRGHVHDRAGQQSAGGADRHRDLPLPGDAGELVSGGVRSGALLAGRRSRWWCSG